MDGWILKETLPKLRSESEKKFHCFGKPEKICQDSWLQSIKRSWVQIPLEILSRDTRVTIWSKDLQTRGRSKLLKGLYQRSARGCPRPRHGQLVFLKRIHLIFIWNWVNVSNYLFTIRWKVLFSYKTNVELTNDNCVCIFYSIIKRWVCLNVLAIDANLILPLRANIIFWLIERD